ncbi:secreted glycosyl hydrolase [Niabella ginsenosidivorans]|uniref:Secreted glycosyl hydrolase n=2 Tax=Niabella ginsenosidivorans TaxID=1176587 RepID=A0A1A9IAU8_9BACT|nr:secreted glycosyl hydrolase [Niabella ginsenosidivorans]
MNRTFNKCLWLWALMPVFIFSCTTDTNNCLSRKEKEQGWVLLFDGSSASGWHLYNKKNTTAGWIVKDQALAVDTVKKTEVNDLVSDKTYTNFDLQFEWKLAKNGNSGVFINVQERPDLTTAWASGPEYQLLDPAHADNAIPVKKAGTLFALDAQKTPAAAKPAGEWNLSRIKQVNGKIEFYLNGVLTVQEDLTAPAWQDSVRHTHFKNFPEFGKHTSGHIALQDWASGVAFRNIKIREL